MSAALLFQVASAEILLASLLYLSLILSERLLGRSTVLLRWSAAALLGLWLASALFHLLLAAGWLRLAPATLVAAGAALLARSRAPLEGARWRRDLVWWGRLWRRHRRTLWRWVSAGALLFVGLRAVRALLLPPLGWDTLTYHAVKAALWVQTGAHIALNAPGGWSFYRNYFGGGEIFMAWAMLPFHSDLLAGAVDVLAWGLLALVLLALARQMKLPPSGAWAATLYIVTLPALHLSIGSGYLEPLLDVTLLAALTFALRYLQTQQAACLLLSLVAVGLATGIKITALTAGAVTAAVLGWRMLRGGSTRNWGWCGGGLAMALVTVAPWMVRSAMTTGHPLSPLPLEVAGIALGRSTPALQWYQQLLTVEPYTWAVELEALRWVFRSPLVPTLHVSLWTLPCLALALLALIGLLRRRPRCGLLVAGFAGSVLFFFYTPEFSVVRIAFAGYNGRFLVPFVALAVLLSLHSIPRRSALYQGYAAFLVLGAGVHMGAGVSYGWAGIERTWIPLTLVALVVGAFLLSRLLRSRERNVRLAVLVVLPFLALPALQRVKDVLRYPTARESNVMHYTVKYWADAARRIDQPGRSYQVAVTAGPWQKADNWAMYFLMGSRLQNRIHYLPVTASGRIAPYGAQRDRERRADFESWLGRVREKRIDYVMSFHPLSIEMIWMFRRPDLFEPVIGADNTWGLFRVKEKSS